MRSLSVALGGGVLALCLAGCSGAPATESASPAGGSPSAVAPTHAPSPSASPAPSPEAVAFTSAEYGYSAALPADWTVQPATGRWDGGDIDHTADYADRFTDPAGNVYFVLGTTTGADVEKATDEHVAWLTDARGCPGPTSRRAIAIDAVPAQRLAIHCPEGVFGETLVSKAIVVREGTVLIATAFSPDEGTDAFDPLDDVLSSFRWTAP